jgi:hypothetical protein
VTAHPRHDRISLRAALALLSLYLIGFVTFLFWIATQ